MGCCNQLGSHLGQNNGDLIFWVHEIIDTFIAILTTMKKIAFIFLIMNLTGFCSVRAQIITTIAGKGTIGYSGDGGPATAAELFFPSGVTVDGSGNVYIADYENHRIRKINTSGIISTIAGNGSQGYSGDGGPATAAELYYPYGVAVDGSGNVYVADDFNFRVRKINTAGIISTIAGNGGAGYSGDGGPATNAEIDRPFGIAVDGSGNVYIGSQFNNLVLKVNTSGVISTLAGNGTGGYAGDGGAATAAELKNPYGVAVDGSGNVYIADYGNSVIRKVNTSGTISTIAGDSIAGYSGDGGAATAAELAGAIGVRVDGSGNLYIADVGNSRIRKVNSLGIISTIAGNGTAGYSGDGGPATVAELNGPSDVAVDESGNVYIADQNDNVIQKVSGNGLFVTTLQALNSGEVTVFPNPATTEITIQSTDSVSQITITDLLGQVVYRSMCTAKKKMVNIADLPSGMYLLKINGSEVRKFLKE